MKKGNWLWWVLAFLGIVGGAVVLVLLAATGLVDRGNNGGPATVWGKFSGSPKSEWLPDGRKMKLLEDFAYVDPKGKTWLAQKDSVVDGASIPQEFIAFTGGPLDGPYRNASIVHDVACVSMTEPWEDVHFMFYEACRCGGVPEIKAKTMYAAVYLFGPRWVIKKVMEMVVENKNGKSAPKPVERTVRQKLNVEKPTAEMRDKLEKYVREKNPSIEELKALDPKKL
jgi:Protein of unknown function (DUF1353)